MNLFVTTVGVVAWAAFAASVGGEGGFMVSRRTWCIPDPEVLLSAGSDIICAMLSNRRDAPIFRFSEGICSLRATGQDAGNPKRFMPFSPPTFTQTTNVAQGKPVEASEPYDHSSFPENGNDDSTLTAYISGNYDVFPWWMVDLEDFYLVDKVEVLPREGPSYYRFHMIEVRVGAEARMGIDFSGWPLLNTYEGPYDLGNGYVVFDNETNICGRYVVIQRVNPVFDLLEVADIKVYVHLP